MIGKRTLILIALLSMLAGCSKEAPAERRETISAIPPRDDAVEILTEVFSYVQKKAVFAAPKMQKKQFLEEAIKRYLAEKDPYSDYITPEEFLKVQSNAKGNYVGVGMDVVRARDGKFVCFPLPESSALKAGVRSGDVLTHVNLHSVVGKSLSSVISMATGRAGQQVTLTIDRDGVSLQYVVLLSKIVVGDVSSKKLGDRLFLEVSGFSSTTVRDVENAIQSYHADLSGKGIIIDLRQNRGGDLYAAIDLARLFLRRDNIVVSIRTKSSENTFRAEKEGKYSGLSVTIFQDAATASAAEVFLGALVINGRAVSIGFKSYGKGTEQEVVSMSNGAALVLTSGYLITPDRVSYNTRGLMPQIVLSGDSASTQDYMDAMEKHQNPMRSETSNEPRRSK